MGLVNMTFTAPSSTLYPDTSLYRTKGDWSFREGEVGSLGVMGGGIDGTDPPLTPLQQLKASRRDRRRSQLHCWVGEGGRIHRGFGSSNFSLPAAPVNCLHPELNRHPVEIIGVYRRASGNPYKWPCIYSIPV